MIFGIIGIVKLFDFSGEELKLFNFYRDGNLAKKKPIYLWVLYPNRAGTTQCNKITNKVMVHFSIPESGMDKIQVIVYHTLISDPTLLDYIFKIF